MVHQHHYGNAGGNSSKLLMPTEQGKVGISQVLLYFFMGNSMTRVVHMYKLSSRIIGYKKGKKFTSSSK